MTQDQLMGLLRQVLPILGTLATAFGWLTPDKVASLTANILAIAGPAVTIIGIVWAWIANSKASIAASIGASPGTTVTPNTNGTATVIIKDPVMAKAAIEGQAQG